MTGASVVALTSPAAATTGASLAADVQVSAGPHVGSTTQAGTGDTVKYKYTLDPGTATNPAQSTTIALTGPQMLNPSSVQAPGGTTMSYSTDGQTFTPSTAGAKFVRFTGGLATGGDGVATPVSGPLTSFTTAVGGDGYGPILTSTRVLNVWHHTGGGGKVDCHVIATSASCTGYPFQNQVGGANVRTGQAVIGTIDPANPTHLWYAGQRTDAGHTLDIGFNCTDITEGQTPASCGWIGVGTTTSTSGSAAKLNSGGLVNGKLYAIDISGQVYCMDPAANAGAGAACGANPINLNLPAATNDYGLELTVIPGGTRLIARTNDNTNTATARSHLACVDAATDALSRPIYSGQWAPSRIGAGRSESCVEQAWEVFS